LVLLAVAVAGAAGFAVYGPQWRASAVALDRWKGSGPDDRKPAAQELIASYALIGRTVEEVVRDLGPPDRTSEERGEYEWRVGVETKMGRDGRDRPQQQDETYYLKVKFTDGRASFVHFRADVTPH
jgi:hypothetical protein